MKTINIKSLIEIYDKNGGINIPTAYMNYLSNKDYELKIKDLELNPLKSLITTLENKDSSLTLNDFNSFYIGYEIPQINKEFDLLRISKSVVLNIEYKRQYTDTVKKQLLRNTYYLKFLKGQKYSFTYCEKEDVLYRLDNNNTLIQADFKELITVIKNQCKEDESFYEGNLNEIFEPSNYLISPFTKIEEFIGDEYFLTQEQEEVERGIINDAGNGGRYFLITGQAGSGKTLLMYHLAKRYMSEKHEVAVIHVGNLHDGHEKLNEKLGWNIQPIKEWEHLFESICPSVIIIDEIQRVKKKYQKQVLGIIQKCIESDIILIVGGDKNQTLADDEGEIIEKINNSIKWKKINLKGKVRTNKELANFIKVMLDLTRKHHIKVSDQNINIVYFDTITEAKQYILTKRDYDYISYTPNTGYYTPLCEAHSFNFSTTGTSHEVVGKEFENVIVIMDRHFYYDDNKLKARRIAHNPYSTLKQ